jgi:hypothetical protein
LFWLFPVRLAHLIARPHGDVAGVVLSQSVVGRFHIVTSATQRARRFQELLLGSYFGRPNIRIINGWYGVTVRMATLG